MSTARLSKASSDLVQLALAGILSDEARVKLGASKSLKLLSQDSPELVYPYFDILAAMLDHPNSILRWNARITLANLAAVDRDGKLDRILEAYLSPVTGPHLIDAANAIRGAAAVARVKPHLAPTVVQAILQVKSGTYATRECRNIVIGHAIQAFDSMGRMGGVLEFVKGQLRNPRPATRRKAERFVRKHGSS